MQNVRLFCKLDDDNLLRLDFDGKELIDKLVGSDTGAAPKYLTIEADGPEERTVRISISYETGKANVTIEPKRTD